MATISSIVKKHLDAMVAEAGETGYKREEVGRTLMSFVIQIYRETRSVEDISEELRYVMSNLDPDQDYTFMRP